MPRPRRLLVAALSVLLAAPALATNGMRMIGFSPTQDAMGGVGVGATLDAGAVLTNPAGITELERRLDVSLTWFQPTVRYAATGAQPGFAADGVEFTSRRGGSPVPNVGLVLPLGGGFTAGLGAFGVGGMGVDYAPGLYNGGNPGDRGTLTSYQNLRVAPALAYRVCEAFSVGLALNLSWAQMSYDVASGFLQARHATASAVGTGATLGVKLTPVPALTFGLAYETRSAFQDFRFSIPAHTASDGAGGTYQAPGGADRLAFDQPAVASAGVAWRAAPALLLAADVQWIGWSEVMGRGQPRYANDTQATGSMPFDMRWSDQVVYKVGAELAATPAFKVRAGFDLGKSPLSADRAFENVAFPAVAETHFTLGLGWSAGEALAVNVAAVYSPRASVSGANAAQQGLVSYETAMSQYAVEVGVGWRF